jgi:hypothetical protein
VQRPTCSSVEDAPRWIDQHKDNRRRIDRVSIISMACAQEDCRIHKAENGRGLYAYLLEGAAGPWWLITIVQPSSGHQLLRKHDAKEPTTKRKPLRPMRGYISQRPSSGAGSLRPLGVLRQGIMLAKDIMRAAPISSSQEFIRTCVGSRQV